MTKKSSFVPYATVPAFCWMRDSLIVCRTAVIFVPIFTVVVAFDFDLVGEVFGAGPFFGLWKVFCLSIGRLGV